MQRDLLPPKIGPSPPSSGLNWRLPKDSSNPPDDYSPLSDLAKWLLGLLVLSFLVDIVAVLSDIAELALIDRAVDGDLLSVGEANASDDRQQVIAWIQVGVLLATGLCFLFWFHRAYKNLRVLGASRLRYSTGWAIGGWFVPFMNLFRPKQIANDIWRVSDLKQPCNVEVSDAAASSGPLVWWWWAFWIVAGALGWLVWRWPEPADPADSQAVSGITLAGDVAGVVASVLAFYLVWRVSERQGIRARMLTAPDSASAESIGSEPARPRPVAHYAGWGVASVVAVLGLLFFYNELRDRTHLERPEASASGRTSVDVADFDVYIPKDFRVTDNVEDYIELLEGIGPETDEVIETFEAFPSAFKLFAAREIEGSPLEATSIQIMSFPSGGQSLADNTVQIVRQYAGGAGLQVEDVDNIRSLNGHPALKITAHFQDGGQTYRGVTYIVEDGFAFWFIASNTLEGEFEDLLPTFERVSESLTIH